MENKSIQAICTAALTAFTIYLGALAVPLCILVVAMIIDYATGMISAWIERTLSSRKGINGIVKKVSYMALVAVAMGVDWLIYSGLQAVHLCVNYDIALNHILIAFKKNEREPICLTASTVVWNWKLPYRNVRFATHPL